MVHPSLGVRARRVLLREQGHQGDGGGRRRGNHHRQRRRERRDVRRHAGTDGRVARCLKENHFVINISDISNKYPSYLTPGDPAVTPSGRLHRARGDHPGGVPARAQRPGHPQHAAQAAARRGRHQHPDQPHQRGHAQVEAAALGRVVG